MTHLEFLGWIFCAVLHLLLLPLMLTLLNTI